MIIYNFQKEFLGIDEKDLQTLGYNDLAQLRAEVTDFADLFVKTPGHIHNFKHVHWIDFITCAESSEESKVIIHANSKSYKAIITITNAYLVDKPNQKAYFIHLNNLRALTSQEYDTISEDITQKPAPEILHETTNLQTPTIKPLNEEPVVIKDEYDQMLDVGDLSIDEKPVADTTPTVNPTPKIEEIPSKEETTSKVTIQSKEVTLSKKVTPPKKEEKQKNIYTYDPHIASKELGLPLDLIEEFIQDFIDQAHDFKEGLYSSLDKGDLDNVKTLSHKLKGVAANLRIEDAHEVLYIINTTTDVDIIKTNLDDFYEIIAKLSGEEPVVSIFDEKTPQKIELVELAGEEFIAPKGEGKKPDISPEEPELTLEFKEEEEPELTLESKEKPNVLSETETEMEMEIEDEQMYSKEKAANEIGLDLESFHELFQDFVQESHAILAKIEDAVTTGDYTTSRRQVIKLKRMSDNMRIHAFTNELKILIESKDKDANMQSLKNIAKILAKISKKED